MTLLTSEQTACRISKSISWLNHSRQTGDGPPYLKIGHQVRYRVEDVDNWLASKTRTRVWQFENGEAA
ncbi:AlpA family transcriptional regulator [Mesorhizobium sp. M00.F.Ca.ET.217.01.1.1]|uniref:helix-turn-helix transcriptional regulator n=1 Tax=Mesorhizobium sp. M00.F.Ca.ET.217.01.1.1 TaxID=2500529 RepID=UPI000FDA9451|nr:DNA-binding protein [Mesorhizobium sp. M00.F.Ca.ET.217.01.1.1]TGQ15916.1 DNA-binding protein [Mesorhizobium sp. M00.F.Ca.ET.217.01.1.1]TGV87137.1 DNA-binding protein [Mesorhizobium sp. M00.F.Ca.ET.158.01.1.1]